MNIIDALFVTLGLDPSGFKKGAKEVEDAINKTADTAEDAQGRIDEATKKTDAERKKAAEEEKKRQREQEAANKKLDEGYKKIRDSIIDIAAAMVAAVAGKEFVHYITETDTATIKLATNTGNTTRNVMALKSAFESIGGSGDEAAGALGTITKILEDLKFKGTFDGQIGFQRAGFNQGAFVGAKDDIERLKMMAAAIQGMSAQDAQYFGKQAGFSEETINLIRQGNDALSEAIDKGREWNKMSHEDTVATKERNESYAGLHATFDSMGRGIVTQLSPAIKWVRDSLSKVFEYLANRPTLATGIVLGLVAAMTKLSSFGFAALGAKFGGVFETMGVAAGKLASRLSLALAVIVAIYEIWKLGKGLWDWYEATHRDGMHTPPGSAERLASAGGGGDPFHSGGSGVAGVPAAIDALVDSAAKSHGVDPALLRALVMQESQGDPNATSPKGAMGLGQLMPGTAAGLGVTNPYDPQQNINGTAAYLRQMLDHNGGDVRRALASYNWGPGNVDKHGMGNLPGETSAYVANIIAGARLGRGGAGGAPSINVGPVTILTSASKMDGAGQDLGKGISSRLLIAGQSNGNGY